MLLVFLAADWYLLLPSAFSASAFLPNKSRGPAVDAAIEEVEKILLKLEARMFEFLAEWLVGLLVPAQGAPEVRAPHLSFMF